MGKHLFKLVLILTGFLLSCSSSSDGNSRVTIGVAFETLQTEGWVAGFEAIREEAAKKDIEIIEAIADGDANRQLQQIKSFVVRQVDGIIVAPKDAHTAIPMIREANRADIPIVLYNRPAAESDVKYVAVVADNFELAKGTVEYMAGQARKLGGQYKAMVLIGDLGDMNAVNRRDGFEAAVQQHRDLIEVVARVPTEWNQEKALAGVTNAFQAHPDINFIFTCSDQMLAPIASVLKSLGKWKRIGEQGHVLLGAFDGDATAYHMLVDGYLDADGVQDLYYESAASVQAILDLIEGKEVPPIIRDEGFIIHQDNLKEAGPRMWGSRFQ